MLNVLTVTKVSEVISDDTERAGWMGNVSSTNLLCDLVGFGSIVIYFHERRCN